MNTDPSQLPWDALQHKEGGIPWPALRTFAEAVVDDTDVVRRLFDLYAQAHEAVLRETCYADLYVPAVFALAAPRLDDKQRREIGAFLVDRLVAAGRDDDDLGLEVLTAAAGAMGPVVLPAVLDAIAGESDPHGAWLFLWDLTLLAAETDDQNLRERVVRACVELLERTERRETETWEATHAAWTLGMLKCTEYTDLVRRLTKKTAGWFEVGDYQDALKLLQGRLDYTPQRELWEQPVEEWLKSQWRFARDWYARRETGDDADGDAALDRDLDVMESLAARFVVSPLARNLPEEISDDGYMIAFRLVHYTRQFLDMEPTEWDESALSELLLELFPRRLSADRDFFSKIAPVTEAFLRWLKVEGLLDNADALAGVVRGWSDEIVTLGMDPKNWGPAKQFVMRAEEAGIDITDPNVTKTFMDQQRTGLPKEEDFDRPQPDKFAPPVPIVETKPKIGRNASCPCGSGRKYKKCCGSPTGKGTPTT